VKRLAESSKELIIANKSLLGAASGVGILIADRIDRPDIKSFSSIVSFINRSLQ
jgi:hypothetical protein